MRTIIRGGTVVTAGDTVQADVLVDGETVASIGRGLDVAADRVIDASNRYVMPGGIDAHTHMDMPFGGTFSADDFESGTAAAAWGGTTTIVDFAIQDFDESLQAGFERWMAKAAGKAHIDYGFHVIVRQVNDQTLADMDALIGQGVTSFKLFMAYPGVFMLDDGSIFRAMQRTSDNGGLIMMHAENGGAIDVLVQRYLQEGRTDPINHALTRPATMEGEATHRAIALARLAGVAVYIVHLSSRDALSAVVEARDRGAPAFAETCPQYLFLSQDDLARPDFEGAKYVCSPPLRPRDHQDDLWRGLVRDDLQIVSTDHCPFDYKDQKVLGRGDFSKIPNGLPGGRRSLHRPVRRRCQRGTDWPEPFRRARGHRPGPDVRALPPEGHDRPRLGRGHRGVRPNDGACAVSQHAPHARRLQLLRGHARPRPAGGCDAARRSARPRRPVLWPAGPGTIPQAGAVPRVALRLIEG